MTVEQLIKKLKNFDKDLLVVTPGFDECGYDEVETVEIVEIRKSGCFGGHAPEYEDASIENDARMVESLLINF